ncbi:hypothetical protein PL9214520023 [Planktothrix tepida PCC 9214]|uniref:Uncharacterized protein n=1 Tax=Planktothrix tepida PCC 9214 TaxID=671072 RepID=A0A1J1LNH2_9CYAN|nr:hypothetical protein PL9214520023 [Planktothrix tepida PCC 9214]
MILSISVEQTDISDHIFLSMSLGMRKFLTCHNNLERSLLFYQ